MEICFYCETIIINVLRAGMQVHRKLSLVVSV